MTQKKPFAAVNPVIPGFHPDPSACFFEGDFYIVNSSFAYFPGIPVFKTHDLSRFEQIGNALSRPGQLLLEDCGASEGIFAPTIRYFDGVFYIVSTCVPRGGNFVITARNPAGPWSEPVFLDAEGIDPSLYFDDDGTCWFVGTRTARDAAYFGDNEIFLQRLDTASLRLTGETYSLWRGAFKNAVWPEGPHIYKKDEYYYLITAEGGTERHHSVAAARSREITGAYIGAPDNPILTHRHLGKNALIVNVGHGELIKARSGEWFMLMLASRPVGGHTLLGRETFLARVEWQDGWPVVNPGVGVLQSVVELPFAAETVPERSVCFDFSAGLSPEFVSLRRLPPYSLTKGVLELLPTDEPSYMALRLESHFQRFRTRLSVSEVGEGGEAGLMLLQDDEHSLRLTLTMREDAFIVQAVKRSNDEIMLFEVSAREIAELELRVDGLNAKLFIDGTLLGSVGIEYLSTESVGGFTGCTAGMYEKRCRARFERFERICAE